MDVLGFVVSIFGCGLDCFFVDGRYLSFVVYGFDNWFIDYNCVVNFLFCVFF